MLMVLPALAVVTSEEDVVAPEEAEEVQDAVASQPVEAAVVLEEVP